MNFIKILLALILPFFNDNTDINQRLVSPAIGIVSKIKGLFALKGKELDKNLKSTLKAINEFDESFRSAFRDGLITLGFYTPVTEGDVQFSDLIKDFCAAISILPKPAQDAVLFKLCSLTVKRYAESQNINLGQADADTLTQMAYRHAKEFIPEIL